MFSLIKLLFLFPFLKHINELCLCQSACFDYVFDGILSHFEPRLKPSAPRYVLGPAGGCSTLTYSWKAALGLWVLTLEILLVKPASILRLFSKQKFRIGGIGKNRGNIKGSVCVCVCECVIVWCGYIKYFN